MSWMILGYDNSKSPDKLVVTNSGTGGFDEFLEAISPDKACYMYLNYKFGDTGRSRFIVMSYVPEALNGLQKARVVGHRGAVESFIKYYQINWHSQSIDEITEAELNKKLRKAGGADYSAQESNKGNFSDYKKVTREFYSETDRKTQLKGLVYAEGPLVTTPCDITGRAMVAPSTEFLKNTSEAFKGNNVK
uniref:ADF-H domain-containing protein n=1 Tax=Arcella intermedia TaxID=1963864 RepID=A0A6B2LK14_9EUKA